VRRDLYFFLVVVFVFVVVVVVVDAAGVVLAVVSIFIPVSIAAGAGAIAGAEVSAVAASSFFDVHAARTRTAATRARRFIYDLLERQTWIIRRSVHAVAVPVWRGQEFISSESRVKGNGAPPVRRKTPGLDYHRISISLGA
jgi:hypothetical protein